MTTKQYITKYKFAPRAFGQAPRQFPHEIYRDLMSDLLIQLEYNKAQDNLAGFNNAVNALNMKFNAIANKAYGLLLEKHWNYMFATMIVPLRNELCAREVTLKQERYEQKKREYEDRKAWEEAQVKAAFGSFNAWDYVWLMFLSQQPERPLSAYEILGLEPDATLRELEENFAILIRRYHPDNPVTGNHDKTVELYQARSDVKAYLNHVSTK